MRVIGVLDLLHGRAVHARAGAREKYAPLAPADSLSFAPGDALALAHEYIDRFGLTELYVADLDAIMTASRQSAQVFQNHLVASLVGHGAALWLDAGTSSVAGARRALAAGATSIVVGLETLPSFGALETICAAVGGHRVAFSLDLRRGVPVTMSTLASGESTFDESASRMAARAAAAGAGHIFVIDLARVGLEEGPDFASITSVREAVPGLTLVGGGGVRGLNDLRRLAEAGCDGVLVGTALHQGRLTPADVATAGGFHR